MVLQAQRKVTTISTLIEMLRRVCLRPSRMKRRNVCFVKFDEIILFNYVPARFSTKCIHEFGPVSIYLFLFVQLIFLTPFYLNQAVSLLLWQHSCDVFKEKCSITGHAETKQDIPCPCQTLPAVVYFP